MKKEVREHLKAIAILLLIGPLAYVIYKFIRYRRRKKMEKQKKHE